MKKTYLKFVSLILLIFVQSIFNILNSENEINHKNIDQDSIVNDDSILFCIAGQIADMNKTIFTDTINNSNYIKEFGHPLHIDIIQVDDFNGAKRYSLFISSNAISRERLPTLLEKRNNYYILLYLKYGVSLLLKDVPVDFFEPMSKHKEKFITEHAGMIFENSWTALICRDTRKVKVIEDTFIPFQTIKQFQTFNCDNIGQGSSMIQIENADVDTVLFNEIMKRVFVKKRK